MSGHELEPLSSELEALLASERRSPGAPAMARERLRGRLLRLLSGVGNVLELRPRSSLEGRLDRASTRSGRAAGRRLWLGLRASAAALLGSAALALASFGFGGVFGAIVQSRLHLFGSAPMDGCPGVPPAPVLTGPSVLSPPAPSAAGIPGGLAGGEQGVLPEPRLRFERATHPVRARATTARRSDPRPPSPAPIPRSAPLSAPLSTSDSDLAEQRWLLERARTALSRGDGAAALDSLDEHQRRYPDGQLTEEREVLEIQVSLTLGHASEARLRATEFQRRHPGSLLLPAVEGALRSLP